MEGQRILIITGMHRSGTSLVSSVFQRAGINIGDTLLGPLPGNVHGHFEDIDFYRFHEKVLTRFGQTMLVQDRLAIGTITEEETSEALSLIKQRRSYNLWGWKDPRTSLFLSFWEKLLPDARYVFIYRHPLQVVLSLLRRATDLDVLIEPLVALRTWQTYNQCILECYLRNKEASLLCNISGLVRDIDSFIRMAAKRFDLPLSGSELQALYHESGLRQVPIGAHISSALRAIAPEVTKLYDELESCSDLPSVASHRKDTRSTTPKLPQIESFSSDLIRSIGESEDTMVSPLLDLLLASIDPAVSSGRGENIRRLIADWCHNWADEQRRSKTAQAANTTLASPHVAPKRESRKKDCLTSPSSQDCSTGEIRSADEEATLTSPTVQRKAESSREGAHREESSRILQISTYDVRGGAARAAYRLHLGLRRVGANSLMLSRYRSSDDSSVLCTTPNIPKGKGDDEFYLTKTIQGQYIDSNRTLISNTCFSLPYPGYDLSTLPDVLTADVINLHWVAGYQSIITIHKLLKLGKPVIWTLHDQWAFTGGCHYTAGCTKYQADCADCPQLAEDPFNVPATVLKDKLELFRGGDLTIVTPSNWLAECVRKSRLFQNRRVEVIPYSLETDVFFPVIKTDAKASLGIPKECIALLFGAEYGNEKRKGFRELINGLQYCLTDPSFKKLAENDKIRILSFGCPNDELQSIGIPAVSLGYLDSDDEIRTAYSAADIYVLPSLEDNLPNTILESMSCGTPVVAFALGGMVDLIDDETGQLAVPRDPRDLGSAILSLVLDPVKRHTQELNCRRKMEENHYLSRQAYRYLGLYEELRTQEKSGRSLSVQASTNANPNSIRASGSLDRPVEVTSELGPNFATVYDRVLFYALRKLSPSLQEQLEMSEQDRAFRMDQINELTRLLKESESDRNARLKQITELTRLFQESEADRAARGDQISSLTQLLQECEADRAARLHVINHLEERLQESDADRSARLEIINSLEKQLSILKQQH